jgi:hypothetical protein
MKIVLILNEHGSSKRKQLVIADEKSAKYHTRT